MSETVFPEMDLQCPHLSGPLNFKNQPQSAPVRKGDIVKWLIPKSL